MTRLNLASWFLLPWSWRVTRDVVLSEVFLDLHDPLWHASALVVYWKLLLLLFINIHVTSVVRGDRELVQTRRWHRVSAWPDILDVCVDIWVPLFQNLLSLPWGLSSVFHCNTDFWSQACDVRLLGLPSQELVVTKHMLILQLKVFDLFVAVDVDVVEHIV